MSEHIINVNDENFEAEVLQSSVPVLVDFWAEWCGPCRAIAPVVDEIANDYQDKVKVCKFNTEEGEKIPAQYGIRSIPTLMIFKNGSQVSVKSGRLTKSELAAFIDTSI